MNDDTIEPEFKKSYTYIFSFFYLIQGFYNGLQFIVLPIWLIGIIKTVDLASIITIFAIPSIPWSGKFLIGLINDKYGSEKYGRRKPWIFIFCIFAGIGFIITGIGVPLQTESTVIMFALFGAFLFNIGIAIADTALDGLILDVTPKKELGKVQGYTWSLNMFGNAAGGIILGAIFFIFNAIPMLFILEGILLIFSGIFPFYIKERSIPKDVKAWKEFKAIITKRKNWQVFLFTMMDNVPYNIVTIAFGLLILIYLPNSPITAEVTSITLIGESLDLFILFSLLGAIAGIGIIIGSILGGKISDKKRRLSVFIGNLIYIPCFVLSVLVIGNLILGIIMMILIGTGQGAAKAAYQAVRGDLAKRYPDLNSTYYALLISFLNGGAMVGLLIVAQLFTAFSAIFNEFYIIYFFIMFIMAGFQTLSLVIFLTIPQSDYEFSHNLEGAK